MLGIDKSVPDEFAVYSRAPLSLPPDYSLRPPEPGAERPQSETPTDTARRALTGQGSRRAEVSTTVQGDKGPLSLGEQVLLRQTGAADANPEIRKIVDRETSIFAKDENGFADKLMFWQDKGDFGTVVDATKENQRIKENLALGKEVTTGETPHIERKKKAFLEGLLN